MKTDDPKFTAHALGEIEDLTPAERAEIEALLEADTCAAAEAAETRKLAARLREELQDEETQPLSAAQRARVLAATHARARARTPKVVPFSRRGVLLSAIAACLIVGLCVWMIHLAMERVHAARQSLAASEQGLSVPTVSSEDVNEPAPEGIVRPARLLVGASQAHGMNSPSIDVISTTAPTSSFKVAPAQVGVSINPSAADLAKATITTRGGLGNLPGTMRGRMGSGRIGTLNGGSLTPQSETTRFIFDRDDSADEKPGKKAPPGATFSGAITISGVIGTELKRDLDARNDKRKQLQDQIERLNEEIKKPELSKDKAQTKMKERDEKIGEWQTMMRELQQYQADKEKQLAEQTLRIRNDVLVARLPQTEPGNTEAFDAITNNAFLGVRENPLSTFSIDVDTASYAIVRRFLNGQQRPPKGAVRIEEMLNYFTYDYPQPKGDAPFSATMEVAACPWTPAHRLVRIGLKGREIAKDKRPAGNLVFLIDVSGSMQPENKLPLLKRSLGLLIDQLGDEDRVAMVVYAGSSGCVLEPTSDKAEMRLALSRLEAGGSTNGGSGIQLAYDIAQRGFLKGGTNRVILATDGDWNVGITSQSDLLDMIAQKAKGGVFLTVLGFGMGNLKDAMLVKLAGKGNGNYGYIDTLLEAKKLLVEQLSGTLVTIAKDVKIQVEFNPAQVSGYRLIGYEKRLLAKEDFNDDKKDAGEIGAGHTVTALYEVVPAGRDLPAPAKVDALKYQPPAAEKSEVRSPKSESSPELLTLKLRYKAPDGDTSRLLEFPLTDTGATWEKSSRDFRFAAAVAGYGMLLRDSPHKGGATWNSVRELAVEGKGADATGYRAEFISLLEKARSLMR